MTAACSGQGGITEPTRPPDLPGPDCLPPDPSDDFASAYLLSAQDVSAGAVRTDTICPKFDDDYWQVPITGDRQLAVLSLTFTQAVSPIELAAQWFGPPANALLASLVEPPGSASHFIGTNLPALTPGNYYLRVYDSAQSPIEDADTLYELVVTQKTDLDTYEPNNAKTAARTVTAGQEVTGYFSYAGDEDWFVLTPALGSAPVATVSLRWPADLNTSIAQGGLTWRIEQGTTTHTPGVTDVPILGAGEYARTSTRVWRDAEPIYIRVTNTSGGIDDDDPYTLTVTLATDPDEMSPRNDTASLAWELNAPAPAVASTLYSAAQHTLVAENDFDWFRIDRPAGSIDHSLLFLRAQSTSTRFLLRVVFYERVAGVCDPNSAATCAATGNLCVCPLTGGCTAAQGICIASWVIRPVPNDPHGDPDTGGRSPNYIETQLPLYDGGGGALFVKVEHIQAATTLSRPGFSATDTYTLEMLHKPEPDLWDQPASAPKSEFFAEPFGAVNMDSQFAAAGRPRAMTLTPSVNNPGTPGPRFAVLASGQQLVVPDVAAPTCTPLTVDAFTGTGQPASELVQLATSIGCLVTSCAAVDCSAPVASALSGTVYHLIPAGTLPPGFTPQEQTVTTTTGAAVTTYLTVTPSALTAFILSGPRSVAAGSLSGAITVTPGGTGLALSFSPAVTFVGAEGTTYCACGGGCDCDTAVAISPTAPGVYTVTARLAGYAASTFALVAYTPGQVTFSGSGFISYDCDQDWFVVNTGLDAGGLITSALSIAATPLDLRYMVRSAGGGSCGSYNDFCTGDGLDDDFCGCSAGTCNPERRTCDQAGYTLSTDPAAACYHLISAASPIYFWVNDVDCNDGDETAPYNFTVTITGGCTDQCAPARCGG